MDSSKGDILEPPKIVETIEQCRTCVAMARQQGNRIGFVPTMGALHDGHLQLVREARAIVDYVVVSIFVNPTQFGPTEDFDAYPRTLETDLERCSEVGVDLVFRPTVNEMYPNGPSGTFVEVPGLSAVLEGEARPTHFRGVTTVVAKLFQIVQPDLAAFGRKDYQQLLLIQRMVTDLNMPIQILPVEIVREPDGLAMSSRNRYLNPRERSAALVLSMALRKATEAVQAGERSVDLVRQILETTIESEPLAELDSVDLVDVESLEPIQDLGTPKRAIALIAARVGRARLIDNALLASRMT